VSNTTWLANSVATALFNGSGHFIDEIMVIGKLFVTIMI
jgi:hypothetical protein